MIREVIVDRSVLRAFQRRAYKVYPHEHFEIITGTARGATVRVLGFEKCKYTSDRTSVWLDEDVDPLTIHPRSLGTVHTHPNDQAAPSPTDLRAARADQETIFAICAIRKRARRWYVEWGFFSGAGKPLRLTVADEKAT